MAENAFDRVTGDAVVVGDIIGYEDCEWEVLALASDEQDMVCFRAYNHTTGDEDTILLDPADYYDLLEAVL